MKICEIMEFIREKQKPRERRMKSEKSTLKKNIARETQEKTELYLSSPSSAAVAAVRRHLSPPVAGTEARKGQIFEGDWKRKGVKEDKNG